MLSQNKTFSKSDFKMIKKQKEIKKNSTDDGKKQNIAKNRRLKKYRRQLALSVMQENNLEPPSKTDELQYKGAISGFLIIPDEVTYAGKNLSHGEVRMWLAIFTHNWVANPGYRVSWPGVDRLALILGITPRQSSVYLRGLKQKNLLITRRRQDRSSLLLLYDPPKKWMIETKKEMDELRKKKAFEFTKRMGDF